MKVSNVSFSELPLSEKVDFSMREKLVEASKRSYAGLETLWSIYFACENLRDLRVLRGRQVL